MAKGATVMYAPCGHIPACQSCHCMMGRVEKCPVCRRKVTDHYKVYFTVKTDWNSDMEVSTDPTPAPLDFSRSDVIQPDEEVPDEAPASNDENAPPRDSNVEANHGGSDTESDAGEDVPDTNETDTDESDLVILRVYSLRSRDVSTTRPPTPAP